MTETDDEADRFDDLHPACKIGLEEKSRDASRTSAGSKLSRDAGRASYPRSVAAAALVMGRLRSLAPLDREAEALIAGLIELHSYKAGTDLIREHDQTSSPKFLISGWAAEVRELKDGRRQIVTFVLPGDPLGLKLRSNKVSLSSTVALTNVETLEAKPVERALLSNEPRWSALRSALGAAEALEAAHLVSQIVRLGRYTAYERIAHLLLELLDRLAAVHLAEKNSFPMPLTQEVLADATGLSVVHVNRILQQLRREQLVEIRGGRVTLFNRALLAQIADYAHPPT